MRQRQYIVHVGPRFSNSELATDAREAAKRWAGMWNGSGSGPGPTKVVVRHTGEVVEEELWR